MRALRLVIVVPLLLLVAATAGATAGAQVVRLTRPEAVLPDAFSFVRGVRELSDGRLLVADWIENRVALVDLGRAEVRDVLREGQGPQEVRLPMGLVALRGDTTLLLNYGNNRLTVLAADGRAVRSLTAEQPGRGGVRGMDAEGALYHVIPSWAEQARPLTDDSVRIVRWMPAAEGASREGTVRDIAVVQGTRFRKDRSPSAEPRIPLVGFAAQDAWVVSGNGTVMIVRHAPYHVEVLAPGRPAVIGPPYATPLRPVSIEDRRRFVREFSAGAAESGRGANGGMGRAPLPDAATVERQILMMEWATRHPPFDAAAVHAAPDGRLWVGMPAQPGQPVRYDIFDALGRRVQQVELKAGRRVAYVGTRGVYVVADGEDGVQSIERYRLP